MARTPNPTSGAVPLPSSRRGLKGYFAEVGRELKKVSWPSRKEVTRLTGVVLTICLIALTYLFLLQEGFHVIIRLLTEGF